MGFNEDVARLAEQVKQRLNKVVGEEATKQALILPFFAVLGYDVWDPTEVMPEYVADFAVKKAGQFEKVDYALAINSTIVMVVEAKDRSQKAEAHDGQLGRYFNGLLAAKVAIVTNGVEYRFFTDLRAPNVMDKEPFFSFNILKYDSKEIENLKLFHRDNFDIEAIGKHAEEMVYLEAMTNLVGNLLRSPSETFMRFLVGELGIDKKITAKVLNKFEPIIKKSIQSSLVDMMTRSLSQEMAQTSVEPEGIDVHEKAEEEEIEQALAGTQIETTAEELEAFEKIQEIAATSKNYSLPVSYKDVVSYFSIHVGKVNWWFIRLYLSSKKKAIVTRLPVEEVKTLADSFEVLEVSAPINGGISRVVISSVADLDDLKPLILRCYEVEAAKH